MIDRRDEQFISNPDISLNDEQIPDIPFFEEHPEFEVSHSSNIIEKLIHLSRFGNLLTLVVGNNGSGKTRLLNKLLSTIDDDCQVCHIKAQPLLSIDQLFQQVMESFAEETTFDGIPLTANQYEQWVEQLPEIPGNRLLIIDDAEVLSTSVLHELCQLSAMQQAKESPHLHIILFGNYDLNGILEQAAHGVLDEDGIYVIDIPSLNENEAEQWLEYLFAQSSINYLPQNILDDMLERGQGNLAALAECVEEYSSVNIDYDGLEKAPEPWRISVVGYWFGASTILIMLVLGLFFFQDEVEDLIGNNEKNPTSVTTTNAIPDQQLNPIEVKEKVIIDEAVIDEAVLEVASDKEPEAEESQSIQNNDDQVSENNNQVVVEETAIDTITSKPTESQAIPVSETITTIYTADEQFLMSEPDLNYTVQLLGLSKESSVKAFLAKNSIANSYYYRSTLNAKPWFIVVLGSYSNREAAVSARAGLPSELIQYGPWIKQMQQIKKEITTAREMHK